MDGTPTGAPVYEGLAFDDSVVPLDVETAAAAVAAAARRAEADTSHPAVIVSIHWGGEYQAVPSARQQAIARALSKAGADLIAGHGPHVLQRVEWVGETLVAYSLGNFLFDQPYPEDCRWGAILRVTIHRGRVSTVDTLPTVTERGRVRPADPETAAAILDRLGSAGMKR
jgi:poly-gamma-glutamate synthesis protein (capsule biosynthesis protein)